MRENPEIKHHELARIEQGSKESLNDYLNRFHEELLGVENVTDDQKLIVVRSGLMELSTF